MPPEHVDALNGVDLQLAFGTHGYYNRGEQGLSVLGIDDRDYQGIDRVVAGLNPHNGDVLAREGVGFNGQWRADAYADGLLAADTLTPFLQTSNFPEITKFDPNALTRYFRLARDLRILDPVAYAEGNALAKGVRVEHADAQGDDLDELDDTTDTVFRNGKMTHALGSIAMTMGQKSDRPSRLLFVAGAKHRKGIVRQLTANGVSHTTRRYSPRRPISDSLTHAQAVAYERTQGRIRDPEGRHQRQWERNLAAKTRGSR